MIFDCVATLFILYFLYISHVVECSFLTRVFQNSAFKAAVRDTSLAAMVKMPPPPTIPKSGKTVGETVAGSADHSTLFAALKAAGLDSVLNGAGKFCLFAPNNAAFSKFSGKADADARLNISRHPNAYKKWPFLLHA